MLTHAHTHTHSAARSRGKVTGRQGTMAHACTHSLSSTLIKGQAHGLATKAPQSHSASSSSYVGQTFLAWERQESKVKNGQQGEAWVTGRAERGSGLRARRSGRLGTAKHHGSLCTLSLHHRAAEQHAHAPSITSALKADGEARALSLSKSAPSLHQPAPRPKAPEYCDR